LWSPTLHTTQDVWLNCYVHRLRTPVCNDISDDSMGLIRRAQAGGAGFFAASSNVFLGQAHDLGEPCVCDTRAHAPDGCWANGECYGTGLYSLNITHNYQKRVRADRLRPPSAPATATLTTPPNPARAHDRKPNSSGIHPRPKLQIGQRLARGFLALERGAAAPTAKLAGCRLDAGGALTLTFDAALLAGEAVRVQAGAPGLVPLEVRTGPPTNTSSGWVRALGLSALNATSVAVALPAGGGAPVAVRYAWADYPCCPGMNTTTGFCPPEACPLVTSASAEPAVPFFAFIVGGRCECEAPWVCDA
jgi:hypothetical protein